MNENNKLGWYKTSLLLVLLAYLVVGSLFLIKQANNFPEIETEKWQAVFLTDGQVYFGHLNEENNGYVALSEVYYLKFTNGLQQDTSGTDSSSESQNLNLIRLGGEAHGPESEMFIAKDKILFFENLKDTSSVVRSINENR